MLSFPNLSRSYDEQRHGVDFWGYDKTFEILFCVEEAALSKVDPATSLEEAGFLDTFDNNRERIEQAAGRIYNQHPNSSSSFAFIVKAADL